ncbi:hypothetical protein [Christiangramia portivictoriae]|uniref:hypothetical protein n=1 Tax=Christiangramia portivictoriae TaxID=326069 RepID=UPI00040BE0D1|nr:hypothetical protein [Christiangramia portivictoriae]
MEEFSYKAAVLDLIYLQDQLAVFTKKYPEYEQIADILCAHDYFDDDIDIPIPTMTSISRDTGIKFTKVKKQLKEIHDLIFSKDGENLSFNKTRYRICFSDHGDHFEINLKHLPVVPRVGDNLDIPFIKARLAWGLFYVEEIDHVFDNGTQIIEIWCKTGRANQYL